MVIILTTTSCSQGLKFELILQDF